MAKRSAILKQDAQLADQETAQAKLRAAIYDGIGETDVAEIVRATVQRAKDGDEKARQWVFDYVLGAKLAPQKVENHVHIECVDMEAAADIRDLVKRTRADGD